MRTPRLRLLSALLSVAMLFTFLPTAAFAATPNSESDFTYTISDNSVTITGYRYTDPDVIIPYKIGVYPVTKIGKNAFQKSSLTNITIPISVTSIGNYAFHSSSLKSIDIPESVTSIGDYAFYHCKSLNSVNIPSNVTSLGSYVFGYCSSLTSVNLKEPTQLTTIPDYAFYECKGLTDIVLPERINDH